MQPDQPAAKMCSRTHHAKHSVWIVHHYVPTELASCTVLEDSLLEQVHFKTNGILVSNVYSYEYCAIIKYVNVNRKIINTNYRVLLIHWSVRY